VLGCRQVGKPSDFDSDIRRFEACHPIQFLTHSHLHSGLDRQIDALFFFYLHFRNLR
jgi:hypothetical protein